MQSQTSSSAVDFLPHDATREAHDLVYESCMALNEDRWNDYLALCEQDDFSYSIVNYSPEIRREQTWMDRDYKGLKSLIDLLPKHNTDSSRLTRHATVYKVDFNPKGGSASVVSQLAIYRTQLDGINSPFESGKTDLFVIGRYLDVIDWRSGSARLAKRAVRLDTRQVDIGSHYPL